MGIYIKLVGSLEHAIKFLNLVKLGKVDGKAIVYPHAKVDAAIEVKEEWTNEKEISHLNQYLSI